MKLYSIQVTEIRHQQVTYIIEADSALEAMEKAEQGDTSGEVENGSYEIAGRFTAAGSLAEID